MWIHSKVRASRQSRPGSRRRSSSPVWIGMFPPKMLSFSFEQSSIASLSDNYGPTLGISKRDRGRELLLVLRLSRCRITRQIAFSCCSSQQWRGSRRANAITTVGYTRSDETHASLTCGSSLQRRNASRTRGGTAAAAYRNSISAADSLGIGTARKHRCIVVYLRLLL